MTATQSISPNDTDTSEAELDADSLSAIRSILTEEERPIPRKRVQRSERANAEAAPEEAPVFRKSDAFPLLESAEAAEADEGAGMAMTKLRRGFSFRRKTAEPKRTKPKSTASARRASAAAGEGNGLMDRIRAYRPTVAHIVLACLALFVLMRPWLVVGLLILSVIVLIGVFLITGYDGFWQGVVKISRWYARRRPSRAAAIHARLDRFAVRWDSILDRFPEGTVDALYLPDFGDLAQADARHGEALDRRLAGLNEKGA